jgi:hypothetical protein
MLLKPSNMELKYYFGYAWVQNVSGAKSRDDFNKLLKDQVKFVI